MLSRHALCVNCGFQSMRSYKCMLYFHNKTKERWEFVWSCKHARDICKWARSLAKWCTPTISKQICLCPLATRGHLCFAAGCSVLSLTSDTSIFAFEVPVSWYYLSTWLTTFMSHFILQVFKFSFWPQDKTLLKSILIKFFKECC